MALTSFGVIIVAELGDLTQILTANLAAHYHQPWSVFVGAAAALVAVVGHRRHRRAGPVRGCCPWASSARIAGALLAGFAVYAAVEAARA